MCTIILRASTVFGLREISKLSNVHNTWTVAGRTTSTKSLAQIFSRDISFYDIVATWKGYFKTITLTLTSATIPTLTPTLIPTLTLTQAVEKGIFVSLAGHVTQSIFCP